MIILTHARYGRMKIGRCVQLAMGYVGCQSDVILLADRRCSGRRLCDIRVPDAEFESTRPCLKELKTFLDIRYKCVKGMSSFEIAVYIKNVSHCGANIGGCVYLYPGPGCYVYTVAKPLISNGVCIVCH